MAEVLPMPDVRRRRLKELEEVIASGWQAAVAVGDALIEIRDDGLYTEVGAATFEQYCRSRWALPESRAYQMIDAAKVNEATSTIRGGLPILTEFVGRELAPLLRSGGAELVAEAWEKVSRKFEGGRPPSAREVHEVLVQEGYRPKVGGSVTGGQLNTRILLGQFGDRLITAEKRLNWFLTKDIVGRKTIGKDTRQLAAKYADQCEALAAQLRAFANEEQP